MTTHKIAQSPPKTTLLAEPNHHVGEVGRNSAKKHKRKGGKYHLTIQEIRPKPPQNHATRRAQSPCRGGRKSAQKHQVPVALFPSSGFSGALPLMGRGCLPEVQHPSRTYKVTLVAVPLEWIYSEIVVLKRNSKWKVYDFFMNFPWILMNSVGGCDPADV